MPDEVALVILNLTMPGISGEDTFRGLRAIRPGVPVVLSSGYNHVEATRKFVGKGLRLSCRSHSRPGSCSPQRKMHWRGMGLPVI
jgi:DNA-binding NarL/FixJ family response regulator